MGKWSRFFVQAQAGNPAGSVCIIGASTDMRKRLLIEVSTGLLCVNSVEEKGDTH